MPDPFRTLTLTSPLTRGADVRAAQERLASIDTDGVFGPATADAVKDWRWRTGFLVAIPALGVDGQRILRGLDPLPESYRVRARQRKGDDPPDTRPVPEKAADVMLGWARAGLTEQPAGSNVVPELARLAREQGLAEWYARMGWPWCAFSAHLAGLEVGGLTAHAGLLLGQFNALYVPAILDAAKAGHFGMHLVPDAQARKGDLAIFNFDGGVPDHIGRVVEPPHAGSVRTVEGNTSAAGSQSNGGAVLVKDRPLSNVQAFVRDA